VSEPCKHTKLRSILLHMPGKNGQLRVVLTMSCNECGAPFRFAGTGPAELYLSEDRQVLNVWAGEVPEIERKVKVGPKWEPWRRKLDLILGENRDGLQYSDLSDDDQEEIQACFEIGLSPEEAFASYEDVEDVE
jgi:hypothetical protein